MNVSNFASWKDDIVVVKEVEALEDHTWGGRVGLMEIKTKKRKTNFNTGISLRVQFLPLNI